MDQRATRTDAAAGTDTARPARLVRARTARYAPPAKEETKPIMLAKEVRKGEGCEWGGGGRWRGGNERAGRRGTGTGCSCDHADETTTARHGWAGGGARVGVDQGGGGVKGRGSQSRAQDWERAVPHIGPLKAAKSTGNHPGGCGWGLWALLPKYPLPKRVQAGGSRRDRIRLLGTGELRGHACWGSRSSSLRMYIDSGLSSRRCSSSARIVTRRGSAPVGLTQQPAWLPLFKCAGQVPDEET